MQIISEATIMFAQLWNSAFLFCFCFSASSTNAFDKSWSITTEIKHIGWQCELYVMQHYRANTTHTMKYNRNNKHQDHIELHDPRNIFLSHICEAGASLEQWKKKKKQKFAMPSNVFDYYTWVPYGFLYKFDQQFLTHIIELLFKN